jgi:hypothetical protein
MGKDLTPNKDIDFTATFTVQGELPFTQGTEETPPTVTYEPDEPATREDSRMRIKDIASSTAKIYIRRAGSDDTEPADAKTVIYVGDTLIVKKGYGAIVDLNAYDASEFMLRPGTELTIRGKQKVSVFGEALLRLGEHLGKWASEEDYNEEFGIETNRANTSITGTIVVIRDDGEESSLKVIEGTAEFTDKATGDTVRVKAGKMITATEDGPGKIEPFDAEAELSEWEEKFGPLEINKDTAGFPLWAILTIAGGAALVALIAVIAAVSRRRKRRARVQPVIPAAAYPAYAQNVSPSSVRNARTAATGYPPPAQGAPPPLRNLFCSQCGARLNPGALFCSECGSKAD